VSSIQTYIGSAFANYPVRWVVTPEAARSEYALGKIAEKPGKATVDSDQGKPKSASGDVLDLSPEVKKALELGESDTKIQLDSKSDATKTVSNAVGSSKTLAVGGELTPEQQQQVASMQARDQEVRAHEMAHVAAGGAHGTSGPSYEYEIGPDGKGYAVGGSVGIDTSPVKGNPEATIEKMQAVAAAALAPAKPSGQDLKVASAARQAEAKARTELVKERQEQRTETESDSEKEKASAFSFVRLADKEAEVSPKAKAEDSVMPSLLAQAQPQQTLPKSGPESSPGSAYKARSAMTLSAPRFSAFA
jgi:hypothetical protein